LVCAAFLGCPMLTERSTRDHVLFGDIRRPVRSRIERLADHVETARILIVDDNRAHVRFVEQLLGAAGYQFVQSTTDAREALVRYRSMQPDLVLLDLKMPYLDGVAVLEQLKAEVAMGDYVPMVILTTDATIEDKRRALSAGANDFLPTPVDQIDLVLRISNLLTIRRLYRAFHEHRRSLELARRVLAARGSS
jgi:CheY-like chemotaxis protein